MDGIYEFPEKAYYGKNMPKNKIYAYSSPTARVKELFVREVDKITWSYKLSPKTINLPASGFVQEIQVLTIDLKGEYLDHDVLTVIDKAIPSPIIFVLSCKNRIRYAIAYKRQSEADKSKRVISNYFESDWFAYTSEKKTLPVTVNLNGLYQSLLRAFIPVMPIKNESIDDLVVRAEQLKIKEREVHQLGLSINKEKQFNRKVEMHAELVKLNKEIDKLRLN